MAVISDFFFFIVTATLWWTDRTLLALFWDHSHLYRTEIKDKLRCYDFDVHTMKTLKNIISSPWEVDMDRQSLDVSGIMALESTNLLPKSSDARSAVEEALEIEMNESDMMLETSMSDHNVLCEDTPLPARTGNEPLASPQRHLYSVANELCTCLSGLCERHVALQGFYIFTVNCKMNSPIVCVCVCFFFNILLWTLL
ncbi:hypothetical protein AB205_0032370 [Aquarana catesbeiana]|uniref:Uncharacterized protein n=1 Tax=Aquarana catesbeiana TaxID=8400 RepID=A0A2G9S7N3_AQUCT|nr:hypothetical protein AB205_0032370 [Aquarana catesbeiana]